MLKNKIKPKNKENAVTVIFPRMACTIGNWAMDHKFFYEIGGLDSGMHLWGGENVDIAIRVRTSVYELKNTF